MRIKVINARDFTPDDDRSVTLALKGGEERTVKREWGEALVEAGDAEEIDAPARQADDDKSAKGKKGLGDWDKDGKPGGDAAAKSGA